MVEFEVRWTEFNRTDQIVTKQRILKSAKARAGFVSRLENKPNFYEVTAYSEE